MADAPTTPLPGSMTVPPTAGWEDILVLLLALLVAVAVTFLLTGTARDDATRRAEWQSYLAARSGRYHAGDAGAPATATPAGTGDGPSSAQEGVPGSRRDEPVD